MTGLEELQKHDSEGDRNNELGREVTRRTNKKGMRGEGTSITGKVGYILISWTLSFSEFKSGCCEM
jgi:hypothetical protein